MITNQHLRNEPPRKVRSLSPWNKTEEDAVKFIALTIPDLYQSPCQQGAPEKFQVMTDKLAELGIFKTIEQVRRVWKERLCGNIIAPSVQPQHYEIMGTYFSKYINEWSFIAEEFCRDHGLEILYYPANSIKNFFQDNLEGKAIKARCLQAANESISQGSAETESVHRVIKKRKKDEPSSIQKRSKKNSSTTSYTYSSSLEETPLTQIPPIETLIAKISGAPLRTSGSSTTSSSSSLESPNFPRNHTPTDYTDLQSFDLCLVTAEKIRKRIAQGEIQEIVFQEYTDRTDYQNLCHFFSFIQTNFPEALTIDILSLENELQKMQKRIEIHEDFLQTFQKDLEHLNKELRVHQTQPNSKFSIPKDRLTVEDLSFDTTNPFNEPIPPKTGYSTLADSSNQDAHDDISLFNDFTDEEWL